MRTHHRPPPPTHTKLTRPGGDQGARPAADPGPVRPQTIPHPAGRPEPTAGTGRPRRRCCRKPPASSPPTPRSSWTPRPSPCIGWPQQSPAPSTPTARPVTAAPPPARGRHRVTNVSRGRCVLDDALPAIGSLPTTRPCTTRSNPPDWQRRAAPAGSEPERPATRFYLCDSAADEINSYPYQKPAAASRSADAASYAGATARAWRTRPARSASR